MIEHVKRGNGYALGTYFEHRNHAIKMKKVATNQSDV